MTLPFRPALVLFLTLACAVLGYSYWLASSAPFLAHPDLMSFAMTVDLCVGIPALFYVLVIRKSRLTPLSLVGVTVLTIVLAHGILPPAHRTYLTWMKQGMGLVEVAVIGWGMLHLRKIILRYRQLQRHQSDFLTHARRAICETTSLPQKVVYLLVGEMAVLYYTLLGWRLSAEAKPGQQLLTAYRENGYAGLWGVFVFLGLLETGLIHLLVAHWYPTAAWVLTLISLYSLLFLIGDFVALVKRPTLLTAEALQLRVGLRWQAVIARDEILDLTLVQDVPPQAPDHLSTELFGTPNVQLRLRTPRPVEGPYGLRKTVSLIAFWADDPQNVMQWWQSASPRS
ncbi:hypothetical protein SAMN05421823_106301 [Catalinimonas alkaloidigena]|uniref:Uncharacterized protein n=1 Tax=Catalinimonas alkaloidigena TaxID=1075417 RepID=A0A1G9L079_9BACT|nr:hypothetical protein [Catalinimonas alkaloidigena]SDL55309.1 hypothetical protein SAMN05421823_106301 [Catalinimonas alkaloidigena]